MTREEALQALSAGASHTRVQGARALSHVGTPQDLGLIKSALTRETVAYVQYALRDTIKDLTTQMVPFETKGEDEAELSDDARRRIYGQAVEWVTGFLLHEIASPVGLARLTGKLEFGDSWAGSKTLHHLDTVHRIFDAIEKLKNAAGTPRPQEFDLPTSLEDLVATQVPHASEWITFTGPKPYVINGDHTLIEMAIGNGLRNAVEAVELLEDSPGAHSIIVNWGMTDIDYWVSILDRGVGIAGSVETAFLVGNSTKKNHSGFGLAIARQAINTLNGSLALDPANGGGAVYVARWKR